MAKIKIRQNGHEQEIVRQVTVVPPAPEITTVKARGSALIIAGKAYPESQVFITISSDPVTVQTRANSQGAFEYVFESPEQVFESGKHEIKAYAAVTTNNQEIKGITSQTYDFFVNYEGQLAVYKKQAAVWKYSTFTLALILLIILAFGLTKKFRLKKRST